jgi:hypothetical protein
MEAVGDEIFTATLAAALIFDLLERVYRASRLEVGRAEDDP